MTGHAAKWVTLPDFKSKRLGQYLAQIVSRYYCLGYNANRERTMRRAITYSIFFAQGVAFRAMNDATPPNTISQLADRVERIREELFSIQKSLEKMEPVEAAVRSAESPIKTR